MLISWICILFNWSVCLFLCHYLAVLIATALYICWSWLLCCLLFCFWCLGLLQVFGFPCVSVWILVSFFFKKENIFLSFHFHLCVSVSMRQQIDGSCFDPFNPIYIFWLLNLCHLHSVLILKVTFVHFKNIFSFFLLWIPFVCFLCDFLLLYLL